MQGLRLRTVVRATVPIGSFIALWLLPGLALAGNWPAWRGPTGQGVTEETDLPLEWSPTRGIRWKTPLPGPGNSTPVVWGSRVFITQATEKGRERSTLAFNRENGQLWWESTVGHEKEEPTHDDNYFCSASPATDGERLIVSHGSAGALCYDLDGRELWRRELGEFRHIWGNASSPVIHGDLCIMSCGPGERTLLVALDKRTGTTVWQVDIPGGREGGESSTWTGSWSTPLPWKERREGKDRDVLLVSYPHRLLALEPAKGKELWRCEGLGNLVYASPIAGDGIVVAMSGYMGPAMAVRAGGAGDVTATHRLWRTERCPQRIGSGVVRDGHVYIVNDAGVAECIKMAAGERVWQERLGTRAWSSSLLSGDRIYTPSEDGKVHVMRAAPKFERLATNDLGELTRASIAVSNGELFIRTYKHLWCIGAVKGPRGEASKD